MIIVGHFSFIGWTKRGYKIIKKFIHDIITPTVKQTHFVLLDLILYPVTSWILVFTGMTV